MDKKKKKGEWLHNLHGAKEVVKNIRQQGVCHKVALPFTLKSYFNAKEELWKFKYFTMQKYNFPKKSSKRNQNPSRYYYNSRTNLKFQHNLKYYYHFSKILI
jgi:hypothetical protein